jgi:predicted alpha/beta-fold hydrolase
MIINSTFKPAWWLTNCHVQTIYSTLVSRPKAVIDYTERLELPDGDFIDLAWSTNGLKADTPLVVLLHGLGGSVHSVYVAGLLRSFNKTGYRGVLMHFRGASGESNRLARAYHSGDTGDLTYLLECLDRREPSTKKAVVGVSLGGNVLLKWLGEAGPQSLIETAVAVSVPFQLNLVTNKVNRGFSRIYQARLLKKLRSIFLQKLDMVNTQLSLSKSDLFALKTLTAFDDRITAPLHGFKNADFYYRESSSRKYLKRIATPTLIIHALDDPFMVPEAVPNAHELSPDIRFELSEHGGHVGFISGKNPIHPVYWLEQRIPNFLTDYL